jgi:hypothetical protein
MRFKVAVEGAIQSVGRTGSQTTNTRMSRMACCFNATSIAEAPCKQYVQVGESKVTTRTESFAALKALRSSSKLTAVKRERGGWPAGAVLPAYR